MHLHLMFAFCVAPRSLSVFGMRLGVTSVSSIKITVQGRSHDSAEFAGFCQGSVDLRPTLCTEKLRVMS